jgi:hypothetical protein
LKSLNLVREIVEKSRVIHIEEQEVPSDEDSHQSSYAGESDASSGSEYGVKRRKTMTKKRVISPPESKTPSAPFKYDATKQSLPTALPYEVILFHILSKLSPTDIFSLFSTCKFFHEMIGCPTPANHGRWNLDFTASVLHCNPWVQEWLRGQMLRILESLRIGTDDGWIQGIARWYSSARYTLVCSGPGCKAKEGVWRWEYRAEFCNDCIVDHTIRYHTL